ncbi:Outer membrane usher protein FimD [Carnimonas sp. R-84981]|uniref:fimbria/pilus outer membrane usher protein n=1 Tax=Carnimonas bestiolae TaxID=3402172 RepID=UPI003EDC0908
MTPLCHVHWLYGPRVPVLLLGVSLLVTAGSSFAAQEFNASFLRAGSDKSALEAVEKGDSLLPGTYPFSLYLNGEQVDRADITFVRDGAGNVQPCLSAKRLRGYGVRVGEVQGDQAECFALASQLSDSRITYDAGTQRIDMSVAQVHLDQLPRGGVPIQLWDEGITAALLDYNVTATRNQYSDQKNQDYYYLSLNSGFNVGAWRYRNRSVVTRYTGNGTHWQTLGNSLERDLPQWRSRLQFGDTYTNSDVFDSFRFRGAQLSSDDDQLPYSMQMYAPVIRGNASSNARVEIKQNGFTIYSANVAPGPFEINDITPSSLSGDLLVRVIEADGSVHSFTQAYSAVPNMLRKGIWRYQLTGGEYRNGGYLDDYHPAFVQMTVGRGLSNDTTPFGGLLVAEHYRAANVGVGKGLGLAGAMSLDLTVASTTIANGDDNTGGSLRFLYSKSLNDWGTEFRLIGHRYSTAHFYDFADAAAERAQWRNGRYQYDYDDNHDINFVGVPDWTEQRRRSLESSQFYNKRSQLQLAVTQNLWNNDQIYANWTSQNYWHQGRSQRSWQVGYNGHASSLSYGLYFQYSSGRFTDSERIIGANLSIPIGSASRTPMYMNSYASHSNINGNAVQTGVSGSALSDNRLSYSAQAGNNAGGGNNASVSADYQGSAGDINGGYSYGNHYRQASLGAAGSVVAHSGGITLGQPLQSTTVLVDAPGAEGIGIENQQGIKVGRSGYALVGGSAPYRRDHVALKSEDIGANLDVPNTTLDVVPTRGAVVRASFDTRSGRSVLVDGHLPDGSPIPLGANVFGTDGRSQGIVGPDGQAFITGVSEGQSLTVRWGDDSRQQCNLKLSLAAQPPSDSAGYDRASALCQPKERTVNE